MPYSQLIKDMKGQDTGETFQFTTTTILIPDPDKGIKTMIISTPKSQLSCQGNTPAVIMMSNCSSVLYI